MRHGRHGNLEHNVSCKILVQQSAQYTHNACINESGSGLHNAATVQAAFVTFSASPPMRTLPRTMVMVK